MLADRIASQLYDLGFRVLDDIEIDNCRVVVISGNADRVSDVLVFERQGPGGAISGTYDLFCKPSFFDNWTTYVRKINTTVKDNKVHVEGPCFMVGKYFMERHAVETMVEDTEENRAKLLRSVDSVQKKVVAVVQEEVAKKPELACDPLFLEMNAPICGTQLDMSMPLSFLKQQWFVRRDKVLEHYACHPLLAKGVGRSLDWDLVSPLATDKDLDLIGTIIVHTRAALMLTNAAVFCFCASIGANEEISDVDELYAVKIKVDKQLKAQHGLLGFFKPEMPMEPKADLVRAVLPHCPRGRLGQLNARALELAKLGLGRVRPPVTPGLQKLRDIGYEAWWNDKVGTLETYAEAVDRVCMERGESRDELMYKGVPVVPMGQEFAAPTATFNDPRDFEAVHSVLAGVVTAEDIVNALGRL